MSSGISANIKAVLKRSFPKPVEPRLKHLKQWPRLLQNLSPFSICVMCVQNNVMSHTPSPQSELRIFFVTPDKVADL